MLRFALCSVLLASILFAGIASQARAVGETYTLTPSPSRILESTSSGVTIVVSVNNAMFSVLGIPYAFSWAVKDPSGSSWAATSSILSQSASWSFSVSYPSSFSGASLNLHGVYAVNVSETSPTSTPNAVNGSFTVGITDMSTYQRTYPIRIQAGGYLPTDAVNVTITRAGDPMPAFSSTRTPDTSGLVTTSWQTVPGTPTGSYTANVVGKNTPLKSVPDTQQFAVYPTNITIAGFSAAKSALEKSEVQGFTFNATYLDGLSFTQGAAMIQLTEPDGSTKHSILASYNSSLGRFGAIFTIPLNVGTGAWTAKINPLSLNDSFGNGGPLQPATLTFNVLPAILSVTLSSSNKVFSAGDILTIQATIITPGGTSFTQGTVQAGMTLSGQHIETLLGLTYDPTREQWIGNYKVAPSDPSGAWLVTVSASDSYGNMGQSSVTATVNVASAQSSTQLWSYLVIVLLVAAIGFIILITRKRGLTRREVKLDIQAIKTQADKVKSDDFLQSIQEQLKRKKQQMGLEKPDHD
jgi:hypothetical protein